MTIDIAQLKAVERLKDAIIKAILKNMGEGEIKESTIFTAFDYVYAQFTYLFRGYLLDSEEAYEESFEVFKRNVKHIIKNLRS